MNMNVQLFVCMCVCMNVRMYVSKCCVYMWMMYQMVNGWLDVQMCGIIYKYISAYYLYVCIYECVYVCMYVCICLCMYEYTCMNVVRISVFMCVCMRVYV